jgi:hypothetical protein
VLFLYCNMSPIPADLHTLDKVTMLGKVTAVMSLLVDIVGDKPIGLLKQTDLVAYFEAVQTLCSQVAG